MDQEGELICWSLIEFMSEMLMVKMRTEIEKICGPIENDFGKDSKNSKQ